MRSGLTEQPPPGGRARHERRRRGRRRRRALRSVARRGAREPHDERAGLEHGRAAEGVDDAESDGAPRSRRSWAVTIGAASSVIGDTRSSGPSASRPTRSSPPWRRAQRASPYTACWAGSGSTATAPPPPVTSTRSSPSRAAVARASSSESAGTGAARSGRPRSGRPARGRRGARPSRPRPRSSSRRSGRRAGPGRPGAPSVCANPETVASGVRRS